MKSKTINELTDYVFNIHHGKYAFGITLNEEDAKEYRKKIKAKIYRILRKN